MDTWKNVDCENVLSIFQETPRELHESGECQFDGQSSLAGTSHNRRLCEHLERRLTSQFDTTYSQVEISSKYTYDDTASQLGIYLLTYIG